MPAERAAMPFCGFEGEKRDLWDLCYAAHPARTIVPDAPDAAPGYLTAGAVGLACIQQPQNTPLADPKTLAAVLRLRFWTRIFTPVLAGIHLRRSPHPPHNRPLSRLNQGGYRPEPDPPVRYVRPD